MPDRVARFWESYINLAKQHGVPERALLWYRRHVETLIDAHPERGLGEYSGDLLTAWLERLGRDFGLEPLVG